jgi:FtsH-binding integral membrane protein
MRLKPWRFRIDGKVEKKIVAGFLQFFTAAFFKNEWKFLDQKTIVCTSAGVAGTFLACRLYGLTTSKEPLLIRSMNQGM